MVHFGVRMASWIISHVLCPNRVEHARKNMTKLFLFNFKSFFYSIFSSFISLDTQPLNLRELGCLTEPN